MSVPSISEWGTPIEYSPPCPCGAPIRLRGPAGAYCANDHLARFSLGQTACLEWAYPGAWRYESPLRWPEDDRDREFRERRQYGWSDATKKSA